jgi:hypothetical protein
MFEYFSSLRTRSMGFKARHRNTRRQGNYITLCKTIIMFFSFNKLRSDLSFPLSREWQKKGVIARSRLRGRRGNIVKHGNANTTLACQDCFVIRCAHSSQWHRLFRFPAMTQKLRRQRNSNTKNHKMIFCESVAMSFKSLGFVSENPALYLLPIKYLPPTTPWIRYSV